jgi:peptidoglycan/LPS O-acetylase OafA/YrhL
MSQTQTLALAPALAEPVRGLEPESPSKSSNAFDNAIGSLRAIITLLVVAHHAVLAYQPFAPAPPASLTAQPRLWGAFPIVDSHKWPGFGLFTAFNDMFFMALMFFLSGLFVWGSLRRKGSGKFLRGRALRLGLPFAVAAAVVAPLAYYPAYLQTLQRGASGLGFWRQWLSLGNWPAGPAWFLWVLLAFDAVAAGLFLLAPSWGDRLGRLTAAASPIVFWVLLVAVSAAAYIPMVIAFNPFAWASFGPFFFQTSRIFHYLAYFLAGVAVGAYGLQRGLLAPDGTLARRWWLWSSAAVVVFGAALGVIIAALSAHPVTRGLEIAGDFAFVLSCATSGFAFLALFVRFARNRNRVFDSLRDNAYGIYLLHYAFVSWLQYALLQAPLSGLVKGVTVSLGALALSWGATAALRRSSAVARVV